MDATLVELLARHLHMSLKNRPWPLPHPGAVTLQVRTASCMTDPTFGGAYVAALHRLAIPLPPFVYHDSIRHAYQYVHYGIERPEVMAAYQLTHPSAAETSAILDAMLISQAPLEDIARILNRPVGVLQYYCDLFFDVRDRNDPAWLASLVYPGTRLAELDGHAVDRGLTLLRVGYEHGAEAVAMLAGFRGFEASKSVKAAIGEFETTMIERATMLVRHVQMDPNQLLRQTSTLISRRKLDASTEPVELVGMTNIGDCLLDELRRVAEATTADPTPPTPSAEQA
jgi:hypothetical protein